MVQRGLLVPALAKSLMHAYRIGARKGAKIQWHQTTESDQTTELKPLRWIRFMNLIRPFPAPLVTLVHYHLILQSPACSTSPSSSTTLPVLVVIPWRMGEASILPTGTPAVHAFTHCQCVFCEFQKAVNVESVQAK